MLAEHLASCPNLRGADRVLKEESGVEKVILHGCIHCNKHVFEPGDKRSQCPLCGGSRYKDDDCKIANEIVYYFTLRKRIEAFLRLPNFIHLMQVEM